MSLLGEVRPGGHLDTFERKEDPAEATARQRHTEAVLAGSKQVLPQVEAKSGSKGAAMTAAVVAALCLMVILWLFVTGRLAG